MGRRVAKKINGVIVEKYLWSGLTQLLAVYDGSDHLLMRFEYSDGRLPNVMVKGGADYYLTYDQVGSLRAVFDATGAIVKRIDYDSFGNIIADTAVAFTVPFGFAGGLHDRDVALVRFGLRDYDPAIGRWTAKDPIGFGGGDTDLYGYVFDDPINLLDPTGELGIPWTDINIDAGEGHGQDALTYWAGRAAGASNPFEGGLYNTLGFLSALWLPCTSDATAQTLLAGYAANQIFVKNVSQWAHWEHARGPHKYPHLQFKDWRVKVPKQVLDFLRKKVKIKWKFWL